MVRFWYCIFIAWYKHSYCCSSKAIYINLKFSFFGISKKMMSSFLKFFLLSFIIIHPPSPSILSQLSKITIRSPYSLCTVELPYIKLPYIKNLYTVKPLFSSHNGSDQKVATIRGGDCLIGCAIVLFLLYSSPSSM